MTQEWHGDDIDEGDITLENENNEPPRGSDAEKRIAKLSSDLEQCRADKQEYMDGWQRAKADYVNALKRFEEERKTAKQSGVVKAAEALLPAFDALERAKEHGDIPDGFALIVKQLESGFSSLGLEAFGESGDPFTPALHDALGQDTATTAEEDETISSVLEKGWRIGETVIRPAKVRVKCIAP